MTASDRRPRLSAPSRPPLPTSRADVAETARAVRRILSRPASLAVAVVTAIGITVASVALENPALVGYLLGGDLPLATRIRVFAMLLPGVATATPIADAGRLLVAALTGVVAAVATYRVRATGSAADGGRAGATTSVGVLASVLGGGCAACGPAIAAGLAGSGLAGSAAILPFGGTGVLWGSVLLLACSTFWLTRGLEDACAADLGDDGSADA